MSPPIPPLSDREREIARLLMEHTEQSDIHHTASMNLISASDRMRKIQTRMLALLLENVKP